MFWTAATIVRLRSVHCATALSLREMGEHLTEAQHDHSSDDMALGILYVSTTEQAHRFAADSVDANREKLCTRFLFLCAL